MSTLSFFFPLSHALKMSSSAHSTAPSSSASSGGDDSYPSSSSATEATHSSTSSSSGYDSSDGSEHSDFASDSETSASPSSSSSLATSSRSSPSRAEQDDERSDNRSGRDDDDDVPPLRLPRLEEVDKPLHSADGEEPSGRPTHPVTASAPSAIATTAVGNGSSSIFPAPPMPARPLAGPLPPYGPTFPPPSSFSTWTPPPPPPLPTLSASAKDITEVDVRAGVRIGVFHAPTRLSKEQVMDEIESVRMTSSVERVLLESAASVAPAPQLPIEEREYAWATVFFADAEAAELCVARLCQPGRRSKWTRLCLQRLPLTSLAAVPLTAAEEQRYRVHAYQLKSSASTPGIAAAATSAVADTVLARSAWGWCVLSTGGLFPTIGLATYLWHRRTGEFSSAEVCAAFHTDPEHDTCRAGGQCGGLHLREEEQWKLLLPVVLAAKTPPGGTSPLVRPVNATSASTTTLDETPWQRKRHADCLVVKPLPTDIDESSFVYMFRCCRGFMRAQTVRTVDQTRYGVVQFANAASAEEARQQAVASTEFSVRFYGAPAVAGVGKSNANRNTLSHLNGADAVTTQAAAAMTVAGAESTLGDSCVGGVAAEASLDKAEDVNSGAENGGGVTHAPGVPFPPLPPGWEYGLSRRTMQYFFLQSGKKSTTWKHPVTQEPYKAKR